jgi:hypothetical protein
MVFNTVIFIGGGIWRKPPTCRQHYEDQRWLLKPNYYYIQSLPTVPYHYMLMPYIYVAFFAKVRNLVQRAILENIYLVYYTKVQTVFALK